MTNSERGLSKKARGGLLFAALLLATAAIVYFWNNLAVVRVIQVSGVSQEEARLVADASGVQSGMKLSDVNEEEVRRAFAGRGEWEFQRLETARPSTVTVYVRKRVAGALVHYAGNSLVIDDKGQVMENRLSDPNYDLLEIRGMEILGANIGSELYTSDRNQILSVSEVLTALRETGAYSLIRELNAKDLDNLYMITPEGVKVEIGDSSNMVQKCNWMLGVLSALAVDGIDAGVVDVSTGASAVYRP